MKTSKQILLTTAFVLLAGLGSVMAQRVATIRLPPEPIVPITHLNAIEISDGIAGVDDATKTETLFGYSFLGRTTGAFPGSFSLSMNCSPVIPVPGFRTELTGGAWTLPVYTTTLKGAAGYAGALYGTVGKGSMDWDKTGTKATVFLLLNVSGGTQTWEGSQGYATFSGILFFDEKTQKTSLSGDVVFNIISGAVDVK
ncbi:MAG: hypothetical protein JWM21_2803 [Acidobacteria bacterium]|nr:hypothetical protein [Acidobacteriota bacterium]